MTIILRGDPRSKKNSMRLVRSGNRTIPIPSAPYEAYRRDCIRQITGAHKQGIDKPINLRCVYYMATRRRVDLVNLIEATCDILVDAGVLEDDNSSIVTAHDGSRVLHDKADPRVEIDITEVDA